jgi:hypothetical protein
MGGGSGNLVANWTRDLTNELLAASEGQPKGAAISKAFKMRSVQVPTRKIATPNHRGSAPLPPPPSPLQTHHHFVQNPKPPLFPCSLSRLHGPSFAASLPPEISPLRCVVSRAFDLEIAIVGFARRLLLWILLGGSGRNKSSTQALCSVIV